MAHDDRDERDRGGRETQWRTNEAFGGGWGNQTGRRGGLGDRHFRGEPDDPDYGAERYGGAPASGYGGQGFGPTTDPDSFFSAPGYDAGFGGPRFDRADVGSTGTHGVHPVSSAIGGDYRGGAGVSAGGGWSSSARRYAELERSQQQQQQGGGEPRGQSRHDPYYSEWRQRQAEQLDRDYRDYCRENEGRFEREFGEWRERRTEQRQAVGRATEHMEVVGSDGAHVGTVDAARGDAIVLTKNDPSAGGHHHSIPCAWVETVDDKVRLNISAEEAMRRWQDVERSSAMFERDGEGPHILSRSFSGTYRDEER
ncbi:MAG TPA: DUF2171 domain-containing protein [Allosphingosinicella sp.]|jgi:hypothetical protein